MRKFLLLISLTSVLMSACSSSKNTTNYKKKKVSTADKVVANAIPFEGTKYKFGGTTKKGMDCSGIVYVAYKKENIQLPRVSRDMAKKGMKISLKEARKGDLLFFRTHKSSRKINHVGLIISVKNKQIKFIHSTSSKGVIISSLSQKYWKNAFVKATKIL
jgi:cell wall-associated NlpC family hydrolase